MEQNMKSFNTSGPNIPYQHYTLKRTDLIKKGVQLVSEMRYFTIWAPRQTGKSTYFRQLAEELTEQGYKVALINFENYKNASLESFLYTLTYDIKEFFGFDFSNETEISKVFKLISEQKNGKCVLIIDEVEGINKEYFGTFLHSIRNAYHTREKHCLKSVILVGVTNILGVVSDNASPFNIVDNLDVPYFTKQEVYDLLGQHETETGQLFEEKVKAKISEITANQPGLVNGFAKKMVDSYPEKNVLTYEDYLKVEDWYLNEAIDKNFENILNKARQERGFVEHLLFTEQKIPFKIDRPSIKILHTNGLLKKDENGYVVFWVPFYKKRLYDAFYPYSNGEQDDVSRRIFAEEYFYSDGSLRLDKLIGSYKEYVKRRGFNPHREKDENGNFKSIKEAALIYSFETYIHATIDELDGKIYREANTGLGKSDMIITVNGSEFLIETKIYRSPKVFSSGKKQLAYYCQSLGQNKGVYLVYCPNDIKYPQTVIEKTENIDGVQISTFLIEYDESKWED